MRIIQSCWTCNHTDFLTSTGGWISPEYNIMSWALSCLKLREFYSDVTLYADAVAANFLIEKLKLPYTKVCCNLDSLNSYSPALWALPKIFAYNQDSPFLHVDGDVFIWKPFSSELLASPLIAQNEEECIDGHYDEIMTEFERNLEFFPGVITDHRKNEQRMRAYNAGILGGTDFDFFRQFSKLAFEFVDKNCERHSLINLNQFNVFFEQYLFYCLARSKNKKVNTLKKELIPANGYYRIAEFGEVPHKETYVHMSGSYKYNVETCDQMANRLRVEYPEYYYRIISLVKGQSKKLMKDYYWAEDDLNESTLIEKHQKIVQSQASPETLEGNSIKKIIPAALTVDQLKWTKHLNNAQMLDLREFLDELNQAVQEQSSNLTRDQIIRRDIRNAFACEKVFANSNRIYEQVLKADPSIEFIRSKYDWVRAITLTNNGQGFGILTEFGAAPSEVYSLIIAACDQHGYLAHSIDVLDMLILQTLENPTSIATLFDDLKSSFDLSSASKSSEEFEELIFARIKKGILNKSIQRHNG